MEKCKREKCFGNDVRRCCGGKDERELVEGTGI